MKTGKRVSLLCAGKPRMHVIVTEPPFPEIGETVGFRDSDYLVIGSEDVQIVIEQCITKAAHE